MFLLFFIFQWDVSLSVSLNRLNEKTEAEIYMIRDEGEIVALGAKMLP